MDLRRSFSSFDGAPGDARHDETAGQDDKKHGWNGCQNTAGQKEGPIDAVLANGLVELKSQRLQATFGDETQGENEVAPGNEEAEDADGDETGQRNRQDYRDKCAEWPRPVDHGSLDQFIGEFLHISRQHDEREG